MHKANHTPVSQVVTIGPHILCWESRIQGDRIVLLHNAAFRSILCRLRCPSLDCSFSWDAQYLLYFQLNKLWLLGSPFTTVMLPVQKFNVSKLSYRASHWTIYRASKGRNSALLLSRGAGKIGYGEAREKCLCQGIVKMK